MKEGRHRIILQELDRAGLVSVRKLKDLLNVTDMTIRRDLIDLEKQGFLVRVHGGAHKKVRDGLVEVPHAEMFRYATDLRSMTQGRGSFEMHFVRYEEVPQNLNDKIIKESKEV